MCEPMIVEEEGLTCETLLMLTIITRLGSDHVSDLYSIPTWHVDKYKDVGYSTNLDTRTYLKEEGFEKKDWWYMWTRYSWCENEEKIAWQHPKPTEEWNSSRQWVSLMRNPAWLCGNRWNGEYFNAHTHVCWRVVVSVCGLTLLIVPNTYMCLLVHV